MRSSWIEVNLDALYHNAVYIKSLLSPGCRFLAPVKGNAYGFGLVPTAKVFAKAGAEYFGVAIPEEGAELREGGLVQPILIFGATFSDDYGLLFDYDLIPNLFRLDQAEELSALAVEKGKPLTVHLSVDTGLTRLGFDYTEDLPDTIEKICGLPGLKVEGIFTMLATTELYPERTYCDWQFGRFLKLLDALEERGVHIPIRHVCDGGGTLAFPEMHLDMARPGTPLYGMLSGEPHSMDDLQDPLQPAIEVKTRLASVRRVPKGTKVGYGATWEAPKASIIGVLPLGFVDGVARQAAGRGWVLVQGVKCPIIGRVCMDQLMIDLSDVPDPKFGEEVVVMGEQNGAKIDILEAGDFAGTSDTEFSCRLGRRLPIRYVGKLAEELGYAE
ncbi:MAG: alanine racemase [Clostridia bacterium]|jgi:alanine racemase|nr:alanine racemase [Clostridia bacterium]